MKKNIIVIVNVVLSVISIFVVWYFGDKLGMALSSDDADVDKYLAFVVYGLMMFTIFYAWVYESILDIRIKEMEERIKALEEEKKEISL